MALWDFAALTGGAAVLLAIISLWDLVWKGIGMWKSGRNNQVAWFVVILLFNTAGILPLVYLIWFQKRKPEETTKKSKKRKR